MVFLEVGFFRWRAMEMGLLIILYFVASVTPAIECGFTTRQSMSCTGNTQLIPINDFWRRADQQYFEAVRLLSNQDTMRESKIVSYPFEKSIHFAIREAGTSNFDPNRELCETLVVGITVSNGPYELGWGFRGGSWCAYTTSTWMVRFNSWVQHPVLYWPLGLLRGLEAVIATHECHFCGLKLYVEGKHQVVQVYTIVMETRRYIHASYGQDIPSLCWPSPRGVRQDSASYAIYFNASAALLMDSPSKI